LKPKFVPYGREKTKSPLWSGLGRGIIPFLGAEGGRRSHDQGLMSTKQAFSKPHPKDLPTSTISWMFMTKYFGIF
jgi:hypothetical protein